MIELKGRIGSGNGTTSGRNGRFPYGTIFHQRPPLVAALHGGGHRKEMEFLMDCYNGVITFEARREFRLVRPDHFLPDVHWYRGIRTREDSGLREMVNKVAHFSLTWGTLKLKEPAWKDVPVMYYEPITAPGEVIHHKSRLELLAEGLPPEWIAPGNLAELILPEGCIEPV